MALKDGNRRFAAMPGRFGGTLHLSATAEPATFNPLSADPLARDMASLMYDALVRIDPSTGAVEPELAQRLEPSFDSLVWTAVLRTDVRWSDGVPFSAHDVVFTYGGLLQDARVAGAAVRDFFVTGDTLVAVSAPDSFTVSFELRVPLASFPVLLTQPVYPLHRYGRHAADGPAGALPDRTTPADSTAGTGPFLFASHVPTQRVIFTRNPRYWKTDRSGSRLPYLDSVVFSFVPNRNVERVRLREGLLDYYVSNGQDRMELEEGAATGSFTMHRLGPSPSPSFLTFNMNAGAGPDGTTWVAPQKRAWFADRGFREAVALMIDKAGAVEAAYGGAGYPRWVFGPAATADPHDRYGCDPGRARRILAQRGFADRDGDSVLEDAFENRVAFTLTISTGNTARAAMAEVVRKSLAACGIEVTVRQVPFQQFESAMSSPPFAWEAALAAVSYQPDPWLMKEFWLSSGSLHLWHPFQKKPATPWEAAVDSMFGLWVRCPDTAGRALLNRQCLAVLLEELPCIVIAAPERMLCVSSRLKNVNPTFDGGLLWNIEELWKRPENGTTAPVSMR